MIDFSTLHSTTPRRAAVVSVLLFAAIGILDGLTGLRLRLFPLYFVPVALLSLSPSRSIAIAGAGSATFVWAVLNRPADGTWPYLANIASQGVSFLAIALLVNSLKATLEQQRAIALTDPLTGVPNARAFETAAKLEIDRQRRNRESLTVAYLDIDDFKAVNASLGHVGADELLASIAAAMRAAVRSVDVLARVGGDEFALLLPGTDRASAEAVLTRLQNRVAAATQATAHPTRFSIGAVVFHLPPPSVDAMLSASDALMYEVKARGKNSILLRDGEGPGCLGAHDASIAEVRPTSEPR